jgi:hypothetical protein
MNKRDARTINRALRQLGTTHPNIFGEAIAHANPGDAGAAREFEDAWDSLGQEAEQSGTVDRVIDSAAGAIDNTETQRRMVEEEV